VASDGSVEEQVLCDSVTSRFIRPTIIIMSIVAVVAAGAMGAAIGRRLAVSDCLRFQGIISTY